MSVNQRLADLRRAMSAHGLDAYIIPSSDPHQSEYVADKWKSRRWVSGFTGSMGYAVVTQTTAHIWTDSRYFLQAEIELKGTDWSLQRQIVQGAPEHVDYLVKHLAGGHIGCDGSLFSVDQIRQMQRVFSKENITLVTDIDLIETIWHDRPDLPYQAIFEHPVEYAGLTRTQKLDAVRAKMVESKADLHLVTTLDDIGWLLNLRGSDVECNPVFIGFLIINSDKCWLFVNPSQVPPSVREALNEVNIFIKNYDTIDEFLNQLTDKQTIAVDTANLNFKLFQAIKKARIIETPTFSSAMKAKKNSVEIGHIRRVMVKDGVALVKAFMWLEQTLAERTVTEYELASMLAQYRSDQPHYYGESFDAIVAYKGNGAQNHYKPDPEKSAVIRKEGILLIDSGGQYADGTTDITRTIALSPPTDEQKRNFTLVLKGNIALSRLKFPVGTRGVQMDILARQFLWQHGLNYGHGTGHGVGFFMNVHEPPQGIITGLSARGTTVHEAGMLTSNEPGFYEENGYGIRIENLVLVIEAEKTAYGQFLEFETVTLFPIDTQLINTSLLTADEKKWFNAYHKRVYNSLSPHLTKAEKYWLKSKCAAI